MIDILVVSELLLVDKSYTSAMTYLLVLFFCVERLRCLALALLSLKAYTL